MLTASGCLARQGRLLAAMERERWDLLVTTNYRTIYWLTGVLGPAEVPTYFAITSAGRRTLISAAQPGADAPLDEYLKLETYSIARSITDLAQDAARLVGFPRVSRYGVEGAYAMELGERCQARPVLLRLRKYKEDDEIEEIRASLRLCKVAYVKAREVIAPGLTELDVYLAMHETMVREAGGPVDLQGDFACGQRSIAGGGAPTNRVIETGDLYPLDIFPSTALYRGDTCRTFSVGPPTDAQQEAQAAVRRAIRLAEGMIQPGVRARDVYRNIKDVLDSLPWAEKSFFHHVGHGLGHDGHEAPRMIPGSDDEFAVGDVFTLEPGVYVPALGGGLRLEDNYVLRPHGIENLFDFPMEFQPGT